MNWLNILIQFSFLFAAYIFGALTVLIYLSWLIIRKNGLKDLNIGQVIALVVEELQKTTSNISKGARRQQSKKIARQCNKMAVELANDE